MTNETFSPLRQAKKTPAQMGCSAGAKTITNKNI
jgi:hypothetical protein